MGQHHANLGNALGARRLDAVELHGLDHTRARHTHEQRGLHASQRYGRQRKVTQVYEPAFRKRRIAGHRKHTQCDGEQPHQHQRHQKAGDRHAQKCYDAQDRIGTRPVLKGGNDAAGQRDKQCDKLCQNRQRQRRSKMLGNRLRDGLMHKIRIAQIPGQHTAHPLKVALRQRLVKPQAFVDALDLVGRGLHAEHRRGGVARRKIDNQKHDDRDDEHHRDHRADTFERVL